MASVQILDGGLGTSLQDKYGVKFDSSTPLWASHLLVADPATLQSCQQDFVGAGTDVLLTATYQVSAEGFERTKTPDFPNGVPKSAIGPFLRTALDVAEQAKGSANTKIALSLGPYGACMIPGQEYSGKYDVEHDNEEALFRWHLDRLRLFAEAEVNLIRRVQYVAFETLPRLDEIRAVRRAIRAAAIEVPFWISCVFPEKDDVLPDGSSVEQVVSAAVDLREGASAPWGIGINCTKIDKLPSLVSKFGDSVAARVSAGSLATAPSLVLYPDGTNGEVYNTTTQTWERPTGTRDDAKSRCPWESQLAEVVQDTTASGHFLSFLVGGCCKASHADIKKLHDRLKNQ
ncbi:catalyzes methyl transfer from S-methylmethionine (SMM) to adenosyl-L-homocysteine [Penicillium riverlandense]|uniref:catalyzes methyl transfer from S-methylmethionine (SMM) to adenosyl-L-homocysteine n=1 Tax=Penicillium riverlandense TaxID=1903569 RepID=UPI0025480B85|nr:catalyzes methyl transfer from S-methylmethionine (SMM) to adenosyl-L-homocysteine [Penicillium riverlandense]KAJ5833578.1 catalyzes methyl transfer from S-methylmethionine (SMM) to adenosyl-L-homocysteine [Penicillium riverlandense]